jgi:hypothetical protein
VGHGCGPGVQGLLILPGGRLDGATWSPAPAPRDQRPSHTRHRAGLPRSPVGALPHSWLDR